MKPVEQLEVVSPEHWKLIGDLTFQTVTPILKKVSLLYKNNSPETISLEQVSRTDSAGLALLVEIMRLTVQRHRVVHLINPPFQLLQIAQAVGLADIFTT
ncbi:MAG: hypothetical protein RIT27_2445 [Pseudomonadota bacterium]|jgi:phospholipid transport system transporter-binding protein